MSCMPFWNATACVCCIDSSKPCSLTKSFITERARSTKGGNVESDVESGRPTVSSFKAASLTLVSIWVYATVYRNHAVPCLSYRLVESDKPHNNKAAQHDLGGGYGRWRACTAAGCLTNMFEVDDEKATSTTRCLCQCHFEPINPNS